YCRTEDVTHIDVNNSYVEFAGDRGRKGMMYYDHLVISCGSDVNLGLIPGMADHAFPLKTVGDAVALRYHVLQQMENAEIADNIDLRKWYLSFVIVGGGFSGVEVAGEINDLVRETRKYYRNIPKEEIKVTLVHSREQILPEVTSDLRDFARIKMEQAGVKVMLNKRVSYVTAQGVGFTDGGSVEGATIVCTVGNAPSPMITKLDVPKDKGRLLTEHDMRVQGRKNVWAIGDCAFIMNDYDKKPSPTTGQFAERQGRQAAMNIIRVMKGQETKPFRFKLIGQLCAIGGHNAVAEFLGIHISGFLAWFLWRSVYLFKLPTLSHQLKVGFDWAWEIFYSRDLAHPKGDKTERISKAHFQPGDYIFREGDPATSFYIVESGEVEVLRISPGSTEETHVAILGQGDFFGEIALLEGRSHSASVRARTNVELTVMGSKVFQQLSGTLAPFKQFLEDAVRRRSSDIWQRIPAAYNILQSEPLASFIKPVQENLSPSDTFRDAVRKLSGSDLEFCCVVGDAGRLLGIVTRTDLFRAVDTAVRPETNVSEFMNKTPVSVTAKDSSVSVAGTMRVRDLKWVPVVDDLANQNLLGYVRRDGMIGFVLERLSKMGM
ncbi:MAG TPA: FAD-dependent oxidoreductase, partial [Thermodesulfobacteriota bacterium]|nr:FAD-dependent oxidoreductase [Thermodesulfobacteriota bacterium]